MQKDIGERIDLQLKKVYGQARLGKKILSLYYYPRRNKIGWTWEVCFSSLFWTRYIPTNGEGRFFDVYQDLSRPKTNKMSF